MNVMMQLVRSLVDPKKDTAGRAKFIFGFRFDGDSLTHYRS
jgi:hypothetical protein